MQLDRLIRLLEMTAAAGRPVSVSDLQTATGLPRPTCYRMVQTLVEHRLLDSGEHASRYVIGRRLIRLAFAGRTDLDIRRATSALLKDAAIHLGLTVFLARLRHDRISIIHVEAPRDASIAFIHPGLGDRPIYACSSAKAIVAFADEEARERILQAPLEPSALRKKRTKAEYLEELARIRSAGYAVCDEEIDAGVCSIAAPIMVEGVGVTFSVGALGHASAFDDAAVRSIGAFLRQVADRATASLSLSSDGWATEARTAQ